MLRVRFRQSPHCSCDVVVTTLARSGLRPIKNTGLRILISSFVFVGISVVNLSYRSIVSKLSVYHLSVVVKCSRLFHCGGLLKRLVVCCLFRLRQFPCTIGAYTRLVPMIPTDFR